jgi:hypothetical protein
MGTALVLMAGAGRIGPDYLGYLIPAGTLAVALFAVIALYRRFMGR